METHFPNLRSNIKASQILSLAPRRRRNNLRLILGFGFSVVAFGTYLSFVI